MVGGEEEAAVPFDGAAMADLFARASAARDAVAAFTRTGEVAPAPLVRAVRQANRAVADAAKANKSFYQRSFGKILRSAARPYAVNGWRQTSTGLITRTEEGTWGHVVFSEPQLVRDQLVLRPRLGVLSAYLMRVVNHLDPERPPPSQFVAAHVQLVLKREIIFQFTAVTPPPAPSFDAAFSPTDPPVLDPESANMWLDQFFAVAVPAVSQLTSDLAIRDYILERDRKGEAGAGSSGLRYAALLTRHLGLDDQLPDVLARAERAVKAEHEHLRSLGHSPKYRDRSTRYPAHWSHPRFLQFLAETPP